MHREVAGRLMAAALLGFPPGTHRQWDLQGKKVISLAEFQAAFRAAGDFEIRNFETSEDRIQKGVKKLCSEFERVVDPNKEYPRRDWWALVAWVVGGREWSFGMPSTLGYGLRFRQFWRVVGVFVRVRDYHRIRWKDRYVWYLNEGKQLQKNFWRLCILPGVVFWQFRDVWSWLLRHAVLLIIAAGAWTYESLGWKLIEFLWDCLK